MKKRRTTSRRRRQLVTFFKENRRLFPLLLLFLAGTVVGVAVYLVRLSATASAGDFLRVTAVSGGFQNGWSALWTSGASILSLLAILFLLGLWCCGIPFAGLTVILYGMGLGMTEAYYYHLGGRGVLTVALTVMPHGLLTAALLIVAGAESMRLSAGLSRQLLPDASGEGLWVSFRLYCLRFLLFCLLAVIVALLDILMRMAFGRLLIA